MFINHVARVLSWAVVLAGVAAIKLVRHPQQPTGNGDKLLRFNDTIPESIFVTDELDMTWLGGDEDGLVVYLSYAGSIIRENYGTGEKQTLVPSENMPDKYWEYWIQTNQ
jgi:dipeptidyl-peptidase 4